MDKIKIESALQYMNTFDKLVQPLFKEMKTLKEIKCSLNTINNDDYVDQAKDSVDMIIENLESIQINIGDTIDMLESVEC